MDQLVEQVDKTGRRVYQYIGTDGQKGRIVSRRQHLVDLQAQGKLTNLNLEEISFHTKRKRSLSPDCLSSSANSRECNSAEMEVVSIHHQTVQHPRSLQPYNYDPPFSKSMSGEQRQVLQDSGDLELGGSNVVISSGSSQPLSTAEARPVQVSVIVRNELQKKEGAMKRLKIVPEILGLKQVCRDIEEFRSVELRAGKIGMDKELRRKLIEVLTSEKCSDEHFYQLVAETKYVRNFCFEDLIQETLACGARQNVLKDFPPDLKENICLTLIEETKVFAPNLLSLLIKFCSKPNEPVSEKQARKIIQLISHIFSCLNQKDSALQKLVSLKLKLFSVTNAGLDFLNDLGITQSSRSWQKDCDFLASISRDYIIEKLKKNSFSFLVDNLDKVIDGELINFTSVILVADRLTDNNPSEEVKKDIDMFEPEYLKLDKLAEEKYMSAVVHILGNLLFDLLPKFAWVRKVVSKDFKHDFSEVANKQTFWSFLALLPLSEQKNSDMVEILSFLNEFTLEMLWKTSEDPDSVKSLIDVVKSSESSDEEVEVAESKLMQMAKEKGLPSVIGDQLTYERAFIGKKLRKGNITALERFDMLQFRMAMFHELMAKIRKDYSLFLASLSNTIDKGNLAFFRARLSKHEISNDGNKIKKDGNFEKHFQFFSSIADESLKSAIREHFSNSDEVAQENQTINCLRKEILKFLEHNNIILFWGAKSSQEPFDDLHKYHSRLVSAHLMNQVHKLFSKFGDGQGLRVVSRVSTPYFLNIGGNKSKYAKYSFKDNVCHEASSDRQQERNDLSTTVNAWGGPNSVDCDEFQEHRIKNIKGFIDNLHGNLDPSNIEKSIKSADLQLKISEEFERAMNVSYRSASNANQFLSNDEIRKIVKIMNDIKPFSRSRKSVSFVEPLLDNDNFTKLDKDVNLVTDFLDRNKDQFSTWGPFV